MTSRLTRLHDDYLFFVAELWRETGLDKLAPLGTIEFDILDWVANGPPHRGVLAPRGIGKTTWGSAALACYALFVDPEAKVVLVSKSEGHAKKIVSLIRSWMNTVTFLKFLAPRHEKPTRFWRDNTDMFDCGPSKPSKDASVTAFGITGQLAGPRASLVIGDDVEAPGNTKTPDAREELDNSVKEFASIASYGSREIVYFGTYHHEQSLYLKLEERGYHMRTWPLLYPEPKDAILNLAPTLRKNLDDATHKPGDIVFDHRIDSEYVEEKRAEGRVHFAMQQMLISNLGDETLYPLRIKDLIVFNVHRDIAPIAIAWGTTNDKGRGTKIEDIPCHGLDGDGVFGPIFYDDEWAPYARTAMWIDPAKGKIGGDKIGYAVIAQARGTLWIKACNGLRGRETAQNLQKLGEIARLHRATEIHVEDFSLQTFFAQLLEPVVNRLILRPGEHDEYPDGWAASVLCTRPPLPQSQKELRIIGSLDPVMAQHRLVIDPTVINNEELQRQLTRITRQRDCLTHDDEIDALANCVALFEDDLRTDPEKAAIRERERRIDEELDRFRHGDPDGRKPVGAVLLPATANWMNR
jgi:hypothetical protein